MCGDRSVHSIGRSQTSWKTDLWGRAQERHPQEKMNKHRHLETVWLVGGGAISSAASIHPRSAYAQRFGGGGGGAGKEEADGDRDRKGPILQMPMLPTYYSQIQGCKDEPAPYGWMTCGWRKKKEGSAPRMHALHRCGLQGSLVAILCALSMAPNSGYSGSGVWAFCKGVVLWAANLGLEHHHSEPTWVPTYLYILTYRKSQS